jgi:2-hydroxychromene-2-carboxylate isomerase
MGRSLEIYWDFSSPFAYLGSTQAKALAERTGAKLFWRPMLLGAVFKAIGQVDVPLMAWSDAKRRYYMEDMLRWADFWGAPLQWPSRFPMNTVKPLRAYLSLPEARREAFLAATFRAYWAEDRDISDDKVVAELIGDGADEVMARCGTPEIKQELFDATKRAVDAGVFGAPTWVVDGKDLYWGQDRLSLVERALTKQ